MAHGRDEHFCLRKTSSGRGFNEIPLNIVKCCLAHYRFNDFYCIYSIASVIARRTDALFSSTIVGDSLCHKAVNCNALRCDRTIRSSCTGRVTVCHVTVCTQTLLKEGSV